MQKNLKTGVNIGGIVFKNPVLTASGTFGYASEFENIFDLNRLGGIVVKGLSLSPARGNPPPRIAETACGMLNAIGLENIGIEAFRKEKLPLLKSIDVPIIANLYGKTDSEYAELADRIDRMDGVEAVELNISCPNVKAGGIAFGVDPEQAGRVTALTRKYTSKPVIVKLSPNVTDITEIAKSVEGAGADCVSLINTVTAMAVDIHTRRPRLANITGGLSGPAIKPIALRMVWQTFSAIKIPVIGIGGIMTAEDALEFIIAGASAVQVGSANFVNPRATIDIIEGIESFMMRENIRNIDELIGCLDVQSVAG